MEVDMAEYVEHNSTQQNISLPSELYEGMFIEVVWSIMETDKRGESILHQSSSLRLRADQMGEEQIKELIDKAQELEQNNDDLENQVNMVLSAKQNLEQMLKDEKKETENLRQ